MTTPPLTCRQCFQQEAGRCFSKEFGPVPKDPERSYMLRGHDITSEHLGQCQAKRAFKSKRRVMGKFFNGLFGPEPKPEGSGWNEDPLSL